MPTIPKLSFATYLYITLGIVILGLCMYCKVLNEDNDRLVIKNSELSLSYTSKVNALEQCSDGVADLKKREDEISKNRDRAVQEAKKKAVADYKAANEILFRKPKAPTITVNNSHEFGGEDAEIQMKDYLATHLLFNEAMEKERTK